MPVSTRTSSLSLALCAVLALSACPSDPGDTDEPSSSTGVQVTVATSSDPTTSSTGTTGDATATTGEPASTGSTGDASTSSGTTGEPSECPVADACEVSAADFCWAVADTAAAHQIGEPYASVLQGMCRSSPACQACWNLANYCVQLADDVETCETLAAECGCQAHAFGKI